MQALKGLLTMMAKLKTHAQFARLPLYGPATIHPSTYPSDLPLKAQVCRQL